MTKLYYKAPKDEVFEEVREKAIEIWETYDNEYGYVDEKVGKIKDLKNIRDNFMFIVSMFDNNNQLKLAEKVNRKARKAISDRMKSGGMPNKYNVFNKEE